MAARRQLKRSIISYTIALVAVTLSIFPIFWILSIALKTEIDAFAMPPVWVFDPIWGNFQRAWTSSGFSSAFMNSAIICVVANVMALAVGIPAAYALNQRVSPGKTAVLVWLLIAYMLPEFLFVIPVYLLYQEIGLYDTLLGLAIVYQIFTIPFTVWLLRSFFAEVPTALAEAARLEGASTWQIIWKIYVPISAPGIAATVILNSIKIWNELSIALALTFDNAETVTLAVAGFRGYASIDWGAMSAAAIIAIVPMALFAILAQRHIVQGLSLGSVK
ncbi:carbohydrate ABC transporter permease [Falsihalocynthiibacter sp. S25ZX9]|uniref:carbohydrate ABC transporter permease n=1 Tax=Falsihalocynthiibacter sp. S25ZX9 TaxID=3240870 RepID=UPI003510B555